MALYNINAKDLKVKQSEISLKRKNVCLIFSTVETERMKCRLKIIHTI